MLSHTDKEYILSEFPNIKLSYENIIYKKVYNADMNVAIPEGIKCFAWFTTLNNNNCCFIMELTDKKQIKDIKIVNTCFSSELSYGTILYGSVFYHLGNRFFCIEDIFSFKGKSVDRENWGNKLFILKDLLQNHLKQVAYNSSFMVFGLPIITSNIEDMMKYLDNVKYKIGSIQFRSFHRTNNYLYMEYTNFKELHIQSQIKPRYSNNTTNNRNPDVIPHFKNKPNYKNPSSRDITLIVKPDLQNDIYHLYCYNDLGKEEYLGIACISDYNTSVFMNKLFRNIKENQNLDALEESDDEEEFENQREDKFVYLERSFNMICQYNYKFKKWAPLRVAEISHKVAVKRDLAFIEKK